jgi:glyoxylase-like metal-dependent hydrolase (beta-lactamase superfamily II)
MIEVQVLPIGPLRTNVVLVGDPERREAIVVDPAIPSLGALTTQLAERGWRLVLALATHGHWDHMGEMAALAAHDPGPQRRRFPGARP